MFLPDKLTALSVGRTGLEGSDIGYGAWGIGKAGPLPAELVKKMHQYR